MNRSIKNILVAPKSFYTRVLAIAVPIMIQNGITNIVGMLDNVMVGRLGTDAMSGVSIVNQLMFVFYLCIFGGLSGIGIFSAQFWGKQDHKGMQYTMRAKMIGAIVTTIVASLIFWYGREQLISLFLHEGGESGNMEVTMSEGLRYLRVMMIGMLPLAITNVYSSTLRETGDTMVPMKAGIIAVFVNLIGNYVFIYGKLGFPAMGVVGAAVATNISRFIEVAIVVIWAHTHSNKHKYIKGYLSSLQIPDKLLKDFAIKGFPLLLNEALWSMGVTALVQCYSVRGLAAMGAVSINTTLSNVFNIAFVAMGNAIAILIGQELGKGSVSDIKLYAYRLAAFSVEISILSAVLMAVTAIVFPSVYNTTDEVKMLAQYLIWAYAFFMPSMAYTNAVYFIIRSGGKTFVTFLFDSCYSWGVEVPIAFLLSRYTAMPLIWLYVCVQIIEFFKGVIGFFLVKRGKWINDLTVYEDVK
ncbi:MAG: MATE family efflux transporter [Saccharofermentans sp.]|nr:MATE family efflux transporter [Saccharofermentans sp.]